ncbi:HNH endonuclease signature motif containing protein [Williamsia sterculiae]|uniref:HNH endonuclease n=1 Tax=Williamsia sterculiae TaxID=1344003 RepID=A0A1N7CTB3_9NOCA|nr:HNH endonuclease signature motif containing protein [Williamsia sterculiae]SIR66780.1 HNH endonuclease [Williamsia sterculiae]
MNPPRTPDTTTTDPPPSAYRYQPTAALRAQILATDRYCRFPFCGTPADDCELDHITPFNHTDPTQGGLTVADDLMPICTPDHHRKHHGHWIPTMDHRRHVTWTNRDTGQQIVTRP